MFHYIDQELLEVDRQDLCLWREVDDGKLESAAELGNL